MGFDFTLNERGHPTVPQDARKALSEVDERLDCIWHVGMAQFAVTYRWAQDDPRRELIQTGQLPAGSDYSIIGFINPAEGVDNVKGRALQIVVEAARQHEELRRAYNAREERLWRTNEAQFAANADAALDNALQDIGDGKTIRVGKRRKRVAGTGDKE